MSLWQRLKKAVYLKIFYSNKKLNFCYRVKNNDYEYKYSDKITRKEHFQNVINFWTVFPLDSAGHLTFSKIVIQREILRGLWLAYM